MPTLTEAATRLGVSRQAVDRWVNKLNIKRTKVGGFAYIKEEDIQKIEKARKHLEPVETPAQPHSPGTQSEVSTISPEATALEMRLLREQNEWLKQQLQKEEDRIQVFMEQASYFQKMILMKDQRMIELEQETRAFLEHKAAEPEEETERGILETLQNAWRKKR